MGKTIAQKIFDAHFVDNPSGDIHVIRLDGVFCHEITTPIAIDDLIRPRQGLLRPLDRQRNRGSLENSVTLELLRLRRQPVGSSRLLVDEP